MDTSDFFVCFLVRSGGIILTYPYKVSFLRETISLARKLSQIELDGHKRFFRILFLVGSRNFKNIFTFEWRDYPSKVSFLIETITFERKLFQVKFDTELGNFAWFTITVTFRNIQVDLKYKLRDFLFENDDFHWRQIILNSTVAWKILRLFSSVLLCKLVAFALKKAV